MPAKLDAEAKTAELGLNARPRDFAKVDKYVDRDERIGDHRRGGDPATKDGAPLSDGLVVRLLIPAKVKRKLRALSPGVGRIGS
ncbi:MAG: hypothetical protein ACM3ML_29310 [Micromonosporaceae bacterium]